MTFIGVSNQFEGKPVWKGNKWGQDGKKRGKGTLNRFQLFHVFIANWTKLNCCPRTEEELRLTLPWKDCPTCARQSACTPRLETNAARPRSVDDIAVRT